MRRDEPHAVRLEEALCLLPDVDALAELRESLTRSSRTRPLDQPDGTVGKRRVDPTDLGQLLPVAVMEATRHVTQLYTAAIAAVDRLQRGDHAAAVRALLDAGELEERLGRHAQAHGWYQHALDAARPLRERQPEIAVMRLLGHLQFRRERLEDAARHYQRSLALAEAESGLADAALACQGLGDLAVAQARWQGAESWYTRGLRHAEPDRGLSACLLLGLAVVARHRRDPDTAAGHLEAARARFDSLGDSAGVARVLNERARIERLRGHLREASELHRAALAVPDVAEVAPELEIAIRLDLSRLYLDWGRLPDAEDQARRAEERAIAANLPRELAQAYLMLGLLRTHSADEGGFIFFENAIALCRGREPLPRLEAEAYLEYSEFQAALGQHEEAQAYMLRAREILEALGEDPLLPRVRTKLAQMGAAWPSR
jgi:tetratricopeptide (TPR) repeat protein